eukprot:TRINITY_DN22282_c0_g1_i1.p4 TRINITY_DN22282_c0_g1~~TRINITY_DN22282_c0_g1_i1.p4  ORF type:complete len:153 (+),score=55.05 TRINITY_DN22282_c0_g1_i1:34-492(+)
MLRRAAVLQRGPLAVGDIAFGRPKQFTQDEVQRFLALAQDENYLHGANPHAPAILPGALTAALISGVMGTDLPGPGSLYLSQDYKFRKPAYTSDTLTACVEVTALSKGRRVIKMKTSVMNAFGEVVVDGEAMGINKAPELWGETRSGAGDAA